MRTAEKEERNGRWARRGVGQSVAIGKAHMRHLKASRGRHAIVGQDGEGPAQMGRISTRTALTTAQARCEEPSRCKRVKWWPACTRSKREVPHSAFICMYRDESGITSGT